MTRIKKTKYIVEVKKISIKLHEVTNPEKLLSWYKAKKINWIEARISEIVSREEIETDNLYETQIHWKTKDTKIVKPTDVTTEKNNVIKMHATK